MTSAATIAGHLPLTFVTGAGAAARNSIGLVLVGRHRGGNGIYTVRGPRTVHATGQGSHPRPGKPAVKGAQNQKNNAHQKAVIEAVPHRRRRELLKKTYLSGQPTY
jgi:hypothetical protein